MLKLATFTVSVTCFVSFALAIRWFFQKPGGVSWRMKVIMVSGSLSASAQCSAIIWLDSATVGPWLAGMSCFLISFYLFWWTVAASRAVPLNIAFTLTKPEYLLDRGPYARIRHPLYTSYLIYWMAGVLVTGWWPLIATVIVMGALYYSATRWEEREFLCSPLSAEYVAYMRRTGLFWPRCAKQGRARETKQLYERSA